jgi:hypothetical protein
MFWALYNLVILAAPIVIMPVGITIFTLSQNLFYVAGLQKSIPAKKVIKDEVYGT